MAYTWTRTPSCNGDSQCAEFAVREDGWTGLRNSKRPESEAWFSPEEWAKLTADIRDGKVAPQA